MDSLRHNIYKGVAIKGLTFKIVFKDGFPNPKREFTLPLLSMGKFQTFIFSS